jgi:hypothetical protein
MLPDNKNWRASKKDNSFQTPIAPNVSQSNLPRMSLGSARMSFGSNVQRLGRQSLGPLTTSNEIASIGALGEQPRLSFGGNRLSIENRNSMRRYLL